MPAIAAWQDQHRRLFGTEIIDIPLATWPEHFPNEAQARFLIVAGVPDVMKAAFTKEVDFFAQRNIEYLDPALTFGEMTLTARRMFEMWGPRLGITEDESDHAHREAMKALALFESDLQEKGRAILETVEALREPRENLETAVRATLSGVQDYIADATTEPWPGIGGQQPNPDARVHEETVSMWFGAEDAPVLRLPPAASSARSRSPSCSPRPTSTSNTVCTTKRSTT